MLDNILLGFQSFITLQNLFLIGLGTFSGIIIGALPGLSTTMGIALFVPLTFSMDPLSGLCMLGGLYGGSVYGGSISATLLRTPGTAASCATVLDGYEMTKNGEGAKALGVGLISSFIGGIFSTIILISIAPPLAKIALSFGSPEYFMVALFGLTIIISLSNKQNLLKGIFSGALGVFISTIGVDVIEAFPRFTFGNINLFDGISLIPALIGLFSFAQVLRLVAQNSSEQEQINDQSISGKILPSMQELSSMKKTLLRSSLIGTIVGIVPGAGADIASFIGYSEAKRNSKNGDSFGTGIPEGVAASEACNNAVVGGSLVPLLTLGVPGNSASAVLLGGLLIHGLAPGPLLFTRTPHIVYGFFLSLFVANIFMLIFGLLGLKVFPQVLKVPKNILIPGIVILSVTGSFSIQNSFMDVYLMLFFGVLGYILEKYEYPIAPIVLGLILGPMAENALWQTLIISRGSYLIFFSRPISLFLFALSVASLIYAVRTNLKS